jgi:hypothetical protein
MHPIEGDELRAIRRYLGLRKDSLPWLFLSERQGRLTQLTTLLTEQRQRQASLTFIRIAFVIRAATLWLIEVLIYAQSKNGSGIDRLK